MEGFTYTNIFETKGIEYLIIIAFFAVLIPFWTFLNKKKHPELKVQMANVARVADLLSIPQGIYFSRYHTWAHLEKNGEAKVGLDDFLLHLTGEVSVNQFKMAGEAIEKGERLARIHYNGNSLEVVSPVSGEICSTNELLSKSPGLVKEDPYHHGWICSVKPANWKDDTDSCFLAEDATSWAREELERVKDFLAVSTSRVACEPSALVMQDGGEIMEKALTRFPQEVWHDFQENFLS